MKNRSKTHLIALAVASTAVVAIAVALALAISPSSDDTDPAGRALSPARTGEVNAMGMPVIATPGSATGVAAAGGVEVAGATWHMGRVPLNVAVRPTWTLRNTSGEAVVLGDPKAEVREGCCPGPFALGSRTLAPGDSTTLTFELSMHPGMDGPHDLAVHVPLQSASGTDHLVLGVTGDFR